LKLIAPFAPYVSEELWQKIVIDSDSQVYRSIHLSKWPEYDERYLKEEEAVIAIQINGKMRDTIKYQKSKVKNQKDVEKLARGSERVRKYINGKVIRKVIFVPGKILNFVI